MLWAYHTFYLIEKCLIWDCIISQRLHKEVIFSENALRVTGKITESFKPFSSHKSLCILDFHFSNKAQLARNLWWFLNTWAGITKPSTKCFDSPAFSWKSRVWFGYRGTRLRLQHLLGVTGSSTAQPQSPCTGAFRGHRLCSWSLFVLENASTVRFYLGGKTNPIHTSLWQLEDEEIKPQRENPQTCKTHT